MPNRTSSESWMVAFAAGLSVALGAMPTLAQTGTTPAKRTAPASSPLNRGKTMLKPSNSGGASTASPKPSSPLNRTSKTGKMLPNTPSRESNTASRSNLSNGLRRPNGYSYSSARNPFDGEPVDRGVISISDSTLDLVKHPGGKAEIGAIFKSDTALKDVGDIKAALVDSVIEGKVPHTNQELQDLINPHTSDPAYIESIRKKLTDDHFMEVKLNDRYSAMIRARDWCDVNEAAMMLRDKYNLPQSDPSGAIGRDWIYTGDYYGRRSDDIIYGYGAETYSRSASDDTASTVRCRGGACGGSDPYVVKDAFLAGVARTADQAATVRDDSLADGRAWLLEGRFSEAASALDAYLAGETEDADTLRTAGIAHLLAGHLKQGVDAIAKAYAADSALCDVPVDPAKFKDGEQALRNVAQRVVTLSNTAKTPDEAFAAAVLMQAQDKPDAAKRLLKKAIDKGLNERLAALMTAALGDADK